MGVFSIVETEALWSAFDEDCKSLDTKLTMAERELSNFKVDETTFQQMKVILPRLKVTMHIVHTLITSFLAVICCLKYACEFVCACWSRIYRCIDVIVHSASSWRQYTPDYNFTNY